MTLGGFIVCDDIRNEIEGKMSLMGIYGETINFKSEVPGQWPKIMRLGIYARFCFEDMDRENPPKDFKVNVERSGVVEALGGGLIDQDLPRKSGIFNIVLMHPGLQIEGVGSFRFAFEFSRADGTEPSVLWSPSVLVSENQIGQDQKA